MTRRFSRYGIASVVLIAALVTAGASAAEGTEDEPERDGASLEPLLTEEPEGNERPPWESTANDPEGCHDDEIGVLRDLRGRSKRLDRRSRDLDEREAAVKRLEDHAAEQIARLEEMRSNLLDLLAERTEQRLKRVAELAKMVTNMKPKASAPLLAGLDEDTAILVLEALGSKQAGKVLGAMAGAEALRLGDRYTSLPDPRSGGDGPADAQEEER